MQFKQILVPTDFSPHAEKAFAVAKDMARAGGGKIHLLHVVEPAAAAPLALAGILPQGEMVERLEASARETLHDFVARNKGDLEVEGLLAVGSPAVEVTRYAEKNKIDLIVTATHGRTGIAHALLGSVAERIVRMAHCPVMVIPVKKEKA